MAEVVGLKKLVAQLQAKAAKARKDTEAKVTVGYYAWYSLYVHENMKAKHPNGQAKFLEEPARTKRYEVARIVSEALLKKRTMAQALLLGGLFLQRESMKLCPVNTGLLRNSAFTKLEGASA